MITVTCDKCQKKIDTNSSFKDDHYTLLFVAGGREEVSKLIHGSKGYSGTVFFGGDLCAKCKKNFKFEIIKESVEL